MDNAAVFDLDGTFRTRLQPVSVREPTWRLGFHTVYVSGGRLIAVYATTIGDYRGIPDLDTGELHGVAQ